MSRQRDTKTKGERDKTIKDELKDQYLHLSIRPPWNLHNHVEHLVGCVSIHWNVMKW